MNIPVQSVMPFFDSAEEALAEIVRRSGGYKVVGHLMRRELDPEKAGKWLSQCLSTGSNDKLSLDQLLMLLSIGAESGVHSAMEYIGTRTGYEIKPVTREQQAVDAVERLEIALDAVRKQMESTVRLIGTLRAAKQ
jgi:hypothetical protein